MIVDRVVRWAVDRDTMFVKHPERARRMLVLDLAIFVVTFASWVLWPRYVGTSLSIVFSIVVGVQLGRTALLGVRRAQSYRSGWLDGRSQMMSSLAEALRRGMSPDQWAAAELQRDMATYGKIVDIDEIHRRMYGDEGEGS